MHFKIIMNSVILISNFKVRMCVTLTMALKNAVQRLAQAVDFKKVYLVCCLIVATEA